MTLKLVKVDGKNYAVFTHNGEEVRLEIPKTQFERVEHKASLLPGRKRSE